MRKSWLFIPLLVLLLVAVVCFGLSSAAKT